MADELPEVDLWGARRRGELFEHAFQVKLTLDWDGESASAVHNNGKKTAEANRSRPFAGARKSVRQSAG